MTAELPFSKPTNRREAHLQSASAGPYVAPVVGTIERSERVDLLTARADSSIADVLEESGALPLRNAAAVGSCVARALATMHDAQIVHGDVKPANVLVNHQGAIWLTDFDAAAILGEPITRVSPGRHRGTDIAEPINDLVALAVMLTEMATRTIIDPTAPWPRSTLSELGMGAALAWVVDQLLTGNLSAASAARSLEQIADGAVGPAPARTVRHRDTTPTIDFNPIGSGPMRHHRTRQRLLMYCQRLIPRWFKIAR